MKEPRNSQTFGRRGDLVLGAVVLVGVAVIMLIAASFARQTVSDMRSMATATSDNAQWTLPQVEVDFLSLLYALEHRDLSGRVDLEQIRLRYDILYSRVKTLETSPVYALLSEHAAFDQNLTLVQDFIELALPYVDGPDTQLVAALPLLRNQAQDLRKPVRTLSVSGLAHFAAQTEIRRTEVADTLARLAIVTGLLFLALTTISFFLFVMYRRTEAKSGELGQANQRMNTILSTSLDGVIVADMQGRVQEFNDAAAAIFDRTEAEAKSRTIGELFVPPHLREAHDAGMKRLQNDGERRVTGKGRVQLEGMRADGSVFPMEFALQSAFDGQQEIFIGFVRDISRRVQAQSELVEARDRALAGEKAKADILTVMSHEIRTPLNGLLGNLSLLEDTELSDRQSEFIRNMNISGRILMGHVDTVLDISKLEAGRFELSREPVDLSDLIQDLIDGQRGAAESHGSSIGWQWVGPALGIVAADTKRLQQVLLNLVGNAIKFTESGEINVELEADPAPSHDGAHRRMVEFRVSDTGIGIDETQLDLVFEDFQTSDASFGRVTGGTGLGLGIARRLVKAMGGEIGVESVLGEGSTFWIRLPFDLTEAAQDRHPMEHAQHRPDPLDVLIVEDNAINRQVAMSMLKNEGHRVSIATDGKSGVDAATQTPFDLILMDISMPVMDGMEATRRIRTSGGPSSDAPIIAVSANVLPQDQERYFEAGMDAFIGKPLTLRNLRNALGAMKTGDLRAAHDVDLDEILDLGQIDDLRANMGDQQFQALLQRFLDESDRFMEELQSPDVAMTGFETLAKKCHKAAGSAAVFGANLYRQSLIDLQNAAHAEDRAAIEAQRKACARVWAKSRVHLLRHCGGLANDEKHSASA